MLDIFKKSKSEDPVQEETQTQTQTLFSQLKKDYQFKKENNNIGYSIPQQKTPTSPINTNPIDIDLELPNTDHAESENDATPSVILTNIYKEVLEDIEEVAPTTSTSEIENLQMFSKKQDPILLKILEYAQEYNIDIAEIEAYQSQYSNNYILAQLKYLQSRLEAAQSGAASPIHNNQKWLSMAMPANYAKYEDTDTYSEPENALESDLYLHKQEIDVENDVQESVNDITQEEPLIIKQQPTSAQAFDKEPEKSDDLSTAVSPIEKVPSAKNEAPAVEEKSSGSDCQIIFNDNLILYGEKNKFATKWHYLKSLSASTFAEYLIDNNMHCSSTFCIYHDVCIHRIQEQAVNREFCKKGILSNLNTVIPIQ